MSYSFEDGLNRFARTVRRDWQLLAMFATLAVVAYWALRQADPDCATFTILNDQRVCLTYR